MNTFRRTNSTKSMHRFLKVAALSIPFCSAGFFAKSLAAMESANAGVPIPVLVTDKAEDRMTRRLASAVMNAIEHDSRFRLAGLSSSPALSITLPSRVGWQRRLDWTEISYQARLNSSNGRSRIVAGQCWNWNLKACAKQILDEAVQFESS